jgi:DNA-binding NarL/FixJ family response regulator
MRASPGEKIRIILVDDHQLFREGLRALLSSPTDMKVVGEAPDAHEAAKVVEKVAHDLVVLDISLPGTNGIALLHEFRRRGHKQPVLILTMHSHADIVSDAFDAGATGYALKHQSIEQLLDAIRITSRRGRYLAPELTTDAMQEAQHPVPHDGRGVIGLLSVREREIFELIAAGHNNAAIAGELFISVKTVETHRSRIFRKLDVHNVGDLIRLAVRHGLLST